MRFCPCCHKYPISDFPLIPQYAVLDSGVTRTLPRHVTATTGMDALTHAVETCIGCSTTKKTRADALEAFYYSVMEDAYEAGRNSENRVGAAGVLRERQNTTG